MEEAEFVKTMSRIVHSRGRRISDSFFEEVHWFDKRRICLMRLI